MQCSCLRIAIPGLVSSCPAEAMNRRSNLGCAIVNDWQNCLSLQTISQWGLHGPVCDVVEA